MFAHHEPDHDPDCLAKTDGFFWRECHVADTYPDILLEFSDDACQWRSVVMTLTFDHTSLSLWVIKETQCQLEGQHPQHVDIAAALTVVSELIKKHWNLI